MNVMVVEDDLISRKWLQRFLGKWGYEVTSYPDGEAAWDALGSGEEPELILADWMMPKMDGVELCKNIRGNPKTHHAYVIMLTARSEKTDLISGLEAGADDYLVKPVDPDELKTRLRVGGRTLSLRSQLAERVSQLESMLRRHDILGEAYTRSLLSGSDSPGSPAVAEPSLDRISGLLDRYFQQMGWTRHLDTSVDDGGSHSHAMTSALVFPESGAWIDMAFELSDESASRWFESMMGRPPADRREVSEGLIENVSIVQTALRSAIGATGQVVHVPFHPSPSRIVVPSTESGGKRLAFESGNARLVVSMARSELRVATKKLGDLTEADVLGEDVTIPVKEALSVRSGCTPTAEWLAGVSSAASDQRNREVRVFAKKSPTSGIGVPLFDPETLLKNTEGDQELCEEIVRCFLSDNSTAFERTCEAVEDEDWSTAVATAHSLKGSVSYFSRAVAREIAEVERAANEKDAAKIHGLAPHVRSVMERLVAELNQFVEDSSGPEAKAS